ncbi:MAG: pilus assembly protein PilM [Patescibacteria group bacterium]
MQLTLPKFGASRRTRHVRRGFSVPLPKRLEATILGLDISDRTFKYVELKKGKAGKEIARFGKGAIPEGVITQGIVQNEQAFADVLKESLGSTKVHVHTAFSLPEELGFTRAITLPRMPLADLRNALALQLEEHVPISGAEAAFDFELLETSNADVVNIVFSAFPLNVVETYTAALSRAGLHPAIAEPESQALARVVIPEREHGSVMVADIGLTRASFFFAYDRLVRFTSTVREFSGSLIDTALLKTGKVLEKDLIEFKRDFMFMSGEMPECDAAIKPMADVLVSEMKKRIEFWSQGDDRTGGISLHVPPVSRVYLSGGESHLGGLPEFLSEELSIDVVRSSPWSNVFDLDHYIPDISSHDMLLYAAALGLSVNDAM